MHSIAIISIISLIGLVEVSTGAISALQVSTLALLTAVGVAVVGVPHGGLDHLEGSKLFGMRGIKGVALFSLAYLGVAALVVIGWYVLPLATILTFFVLSSWHFGLEEDERTGLSVIGATARIARGGMVIWVPALFQPQAIIDLLATVMPLSNPGLATQVVAMLTVAGPLLILLAVYDAVTFTDGNSAPSSAPKQAWLHRSRLLAFALLFATAHPLLAFAVYFCGWHSVRGLIHLYAESGAASATQFVARLAPISGAALVLLGGAYVSWSGIVSSTDALIRTTFVGLSALAIPHLLLHIASDALSTKRSDDQRITTATVGRIAA